MPLVDLKTDLKSLKYGKDRPGGGSSKQPFVQTSAKNSFDLPLDKLGNDVAGIPAGPDFIVRGGLLAPVRALTDSSRLFQLFTQTPIGVQFTAKQNLLSRTAVKLQAGYDGYTFDLQGRLASIKELGSLAISNGLGSNGLGGVSANMRNDVNPLNQGTYLPTSTLLQAAGGWAGLHLNKQGIDPTGKTALSLITYSNLVPVKQNIAINRLVNLHQGRILTSSTNPLMFSYTGGPGSEIGIGKTNIYFSDQRTGVNNAVSLENPGFFYGSQPKDKISTPTLSSQETNIQDFRVAKKKSLPKNIADSLTKSGMLATGLDYSNPDNRIETRVNLGDPGSSLVNRSNYGTGDPNRAGVDKINSLYLYKSSNVTKDARKNDLVKFRIAVIDPDNPVESTFVHFRAYIDNMSDSFNAGWDEFRYLGRGESFYNYQGFTRSMSLGWTVFAQSKQELSIMYQKLNYLASTLAPNYSDPGFIRGNIHKLTVGGYVYEYPGIITSLNFDIPDNSPWEIAIPTKRSSQNQDEGTPQITEDINVKELPHMIKVKMEFKPINEFLPQTIKDINGAGSIEERFLSLTADSGKTNSLYNKGIPDWAKN